MTVSNLALIPARETAVTEPNIHQMGDAHTKRAPTKSRSMPSLIRYRASLDFLCDRAGEAGIDALIEPINPRDMPGYFLNDFNFAADLIDGMGHANLKLQFDIYHRQIIHGDVLAGLREMMPVIGHVQIASVPLRNEPGTGELDDFRVLRELESLGYTGFVGCEYRPAGNAVEGFGWVRRFESGSSQD